jgi:hypothetical protein
MVDDASPAASVLGVDELYPWRGATDPELAAALAQIARRFIAGERKSVGFLPAPGVGDLLPLLVRMGLALYPFQERQAAIVPAWKTWDSPPANLRRLGEDDHGPSLRPLPGDAGPVLVVPPPTADPSTASLSLQLALRRTGPRFAQTLVDLTAMPGAAPGEPQAVLRLLDGVALIVARRKTTSWNLRRFARQIPDDKNLGALLVG